MRVVITGGIGSGKSHVTAKLQEVMKDHLFYSVDDIVDGLYDNVEFLDYLTSLGIHSREQASDLCFENPHIRKLIEQKSEPMVKRHLDNVIKLPNVVVEFPLLGKYPEYAEKFDVVIVVVASDEIRIARVQARDGFDREKVLAIMEAQKPYLSHDRHIDFSNNGVVSLASINELVERIKTVKFEKVRESIENHQKSQAILNEIQERKRPPKVGVMSGSYDPIQLGHVYLAGKALNMVDILHIVVAHNSDKKSLLELHEKVALIKRSILEVHGQEAMARVRVDVLNEGDLLIHHVQKVGSKFIFRGLRNSIDLEYEHSIDFAQKIVDPSIETIYFLTPPQYTQVSSSLVRSLYKLRGSETILRECVTDAVYQYLTTRPDRYK